MCAWSVAARAALVVTLAATACYQPAVEPCRLACSAGAACPAGLTCDTAEGFCKAPGTVTPCVTEVDGGIDADPGLHVDQLGAGVRHVCAVTGGRLWCWGDNARGQLGPGRGLYEARPLEVRLTGGTTASDWSQVAAGRGHTCGRRGGDVYCWGGDDSGEVGVVATPRVDLPTKVTLPAPATDVCTGGHHTCAAAGGTIYCWGDGTAGQRGDDSVAMAAHLPRPIVSAHTDWTDVECGEQHTCARRGGDLYCWGDLGNQRLGRLADGNDHDVPTDLPAAAGVSAYALGLSHTCAIRGAALWCWGTYDDSTGHPPTALALPGAIAPTLVSAGGGGTCASDGATTYCFGGGEDGEAGDGSFARRTAATAPVVDLPSVAALASGDRFHCAVDSGGDLRCWGRNSHGQLGTGVPAIGFGPTRVGTGTWSIVRASNDTTCAIDDAGALACWGRNFDGEVGDTALGPYVDAPHPIVVPTVARWRDVGVGHGHACAVTDVGAVYCWGADAAGQLGVPAGVGVRSPTAVQWVGQAPSDAIATGVHGSCVLGHDATRTCWGDNTGYALGLATAGAGRPPTIVTGVWAHLALGASFGCATNNNGQDVCWGADTDGQRGDGTGVTPASADPIMTGLGGPNTAATTITAGASGAHACAIHPNDTTGDHELYCWGDGDAFALGVGGTGADEPTPVQVVAAGVDQWTAVAAGARSTCAIGNGGLYCWGTNDGRQLGTDSVNPISTPRSLDIGPGWTAVAVGDTHACAIKNGGLYCWGESRYGSIGVAGAHAHPRPVTVTVP